MAVRSGFSRRRGAVEWQRLLVELAESGEGVDEFCRRHRVRPATLKWWRWRLDGGGLSAVESGASPSGPQFTEVRFGKPEVARGAWIGFELRWSDGLTLRIPSEFDDGALRRLLSVLEAVGC